MSEGHRVNTGQHERLLGGEQEGFLISEQQQVAQCGKRERVFQAEGVIRTKPEGGYKFSVASQVKVSAGDFKRGEKVMCLSCVIEGRWTV